MKKISEKNKNYEKIKKNLVRIFSRMIQPWKKGYA